MSGVYKLVQTTIQGKEIFAFKTSPGKLSFPGRKQVYRFLHRGYYSHDEICLFEESARTSGQPLLGKYMENGKQIKELPEIDEIRKLAQQQMGKLSEPYHQISAVEDYPVILSQQLKKAMEVEEGQGS
jgi:nicotinate phosphoribosyltransferase